MSSRTLLIGSLIAALAAATSTPAAADEGPAYQLSLAVDLPLVLLGGALASSFFLKSEGAGPHCAPVCDRTKVNALDRGFAGDYNESWGLAGDIATASTLLIGPIVLLISEGFVDGLNDSLVVAEAALMASALQVVVSFAIGRPRPRVYGDKAPIESRTNANAARSFFSGHVGNAVAATFATAFAFYRLDRPILAWITLGVGIAGSALVGVARVAAGSHFPTDVLAGAAVGAGLGIAIPALHASGVSVGPLVDEETSGRGITASMAF